MKIAILYICTGKYSVFWETFYSTSRAFFYPDLEKYYFVFTDDVKLIMRFQSEPNVYPYFQRHAGWPYDTLLRFNTFASIQDLLTGFDYCYYWNANTLFLKIIDISVIPLPTDEREMVFWRHTYDYDKEHPEEFDAETNPESEAYVAPGSLCHSYGGGFFGGKASEFIKMSVILRDRVARDLEKGIIARAHDQSHIVRYGSELNCVEVPRNVIVSEEYMEGRDPCAIFLNKQHFGGMHKLRGMPISFRIKEVLFELGRRILDAIGMKNTVKRIIGKI